MKKLNILILTVFAILLTACSGSETYRGLWKATDTYGAKYDIVFDAKSFSVKDSLGKSKKYEYTQNSVNIENSVATYGIKLEDGRGYQINFPKADDESVGLIKDENGTPLYTIGRTDYVGYDDVFKLN